MSNDETIKFPGPGTGDPPAAVKAIQEHRVCALCMSHFPNMPGCAITIPLPPPPGGIMRANRPASGLPLVICENPESPAFMMFLHGNHTCGLFAAAPLPPPPTVIELPKGVKDRMGDRG